MIFKYISSFGQIILKIIRNLIEYTYGGCNIFVAKSVGLLFPTLLSNAIRKSSSLVY